MRVGTIGSGVIVDRMIDAMNQTKDVEVVAVYSRTKEKAEAYAQKHQIEKSYHDLEEMLQDTTIDTIYVASPNSLHFEQSKRALQAGKHVICEKPFTPTLHEAQELFDLADQNNRYIFEAITTIHLPNYQIVKEHLKDTGKVQLVQCNFSQFSSRYDKYKNHQVTNVFDPAFNGGALMDINVYCLHFVTGLFGKPDSIEYNANQGFNGIDTSGIAILRYPDKLAICVGAKDSSSPNQVFIQGDQGTIRVYGSSCGVCKHVQFLPLKGDMIGKEDQETTMELGIDQLPHMIYECQVFENIIQNNDKKEYQRLCEQTKLVVFLIEEAHLQLQG